jgi:hypothetical protein
MLPDHAGQPPDGVGVAADRATGRADAAALVEVLEHGEGPLLGEMAVERGRALALGEAALAGPAAEQSDVVRPAVTGAGREIAGVADAAGGALGVLTAEACEVIHAGDRSGRGRFDEVRGDEPDVAHILRCSPVRCSVILSHDRKLVNDFDVAMESLAIKLSDSSPIKPAFDSIREFLTDRLNMAEPEMLVKWNPRFKEFWSSRYVVSVLAEAVVLLKDQRKHYVIS